MSSRMTPSVVVFLGALVVVARSQQSDVEVTKCATSSLDGFDYKVCVGNKPFRFRLSS